MLNPSSRFVSLFAGTLILCILVLPVQPVSGGKSKTTAAKQSLQPRSILKSSLNDDGDATLRVDQNAIGKLKNSRSQSITQTVPLAGLGNVNLELERFYITTPSTQFVIGNRKGKDTPFAFDPNRIVLLRGTVTGHEHSRAFLAISDLGAMGRIQLSPGETQYVLSSTTGDARGMIKGPARFIQNNAVGAPPLDNFCGTVTTGDSPALAGAGPILAPQRLRQIQLAVETDFEYYTLFGNLDDAAAYVVTLYAAVADIYVRDVNTHVAISFVRLWNTSNDMFNQPDPLGAFQSHWNNNMGHVERDVAQFLTGRRNLPYGGVAYLQGLCNTSGYSVAGWINGSFGSITEPSFANFDIIVTAHELGHNCASQHTHDYGIDSCATGEVRRGTIMSYCHTVPGGNANIDMHFHSQVRAIMSGYITASECIAFDCNRNGTPDDVDISSGDSLDSNANAIPDECEDCNNNGTLDPVDIATGTSLDVNANGYPDECETDCNGNLVPDDFETGNGTVGDQYGNGIPDTCEADCNDNGVSDITEIHQDMTLDIDRNARLDSCEDCDGNSIPDLQELGGALNIWIASNTSSVVREFHGRSGVEVKATSSVLGSAQDVVISAAGRVFVSDATSNRVVEFDAATGSYLGDFVTPDSGGLANPTGLVFHPNGNLLVASRDTNSILEYDGSTGAFVGEFVEAGEGGLVAPFEMAFSPNGNLAVTTGNNNVYEFDGQTGEFVRILVPFHLGLTQPRGLVFTPNDTMLLAVYGENYILEYNAFTGEYIRWFDRGGLSSGFWSLQRPWDIQIGPTGDIVYVTSNLGNAAVHSYDLDTGLFLRTFYILSQGMPNPTGFAFMNATPLDCNGNYALDTCDFVNDPCADANNNGIFDTCQPLGDITGNNVVNVDDLLALISAWGPCASPPACCPTDLNFDGTTNVNDLLILISNWG